MFSSLVAGRSLSSTVHQAPSSIIGSPNVSATISCNHSISSYYVILWYQQPISDSGLKLIGYVSYTNPVIEDQFKQHFDVTGDGAVKAQLHLRKLRQPEDSGLYYCAASTQWLNCSLSSTKTLSDNQPHSHWTRAQLHPTVAGNHLRYHRVTRFNHSRILYKSTDKHENRAGCIKNIKM